MAEQELKIWMNAATDSLSNFVNQVLNPFGFVESQPYRLLDEHSLPLSGSSLILEYGDDCKMEVELLSDPEHLKEITRKMLQINDDDAVSEDDVVDAIKEATNLLCGGIKSRLNEQIERGILLGIPTFIPQKRLKNRTDNLLNAEMAFGNLPIYLSIERLK